MILAANVTLLLIKRDENAMYSKDRVRVMFAPNNLRFTFPKPEELADHSITALVVGAISKVSSRVYDSLKGTRKENKQIHDRVFSILETAMDEIELGPDSQYERVELLGVSLERPF